MGSIVKQKTVIKATSHCSPDTWSVIWAVRTEDAVHLYCELAERNQMSELALSWCYHRELVTSTIIGATSMKQLEENLKAYYDINLNDDIQEEIGDIYKKYTDPTKARNK